MGLSLGEYSALTVSQCFESEQDAIYLVDKRARAMQECCVNLEPNNADLQQKMLAIMHDGSLSIERLRDIIQNLDVMMQKECGYVADIANYNSPRQIVISGHKIALDAAQSDLKKQKIRSKYINTGGAFHSALMTKAKDQLSDVLDNINIALPSERKSVIANVEATLVNRDVCADSDIIKSLLCNQVCSAVQWYPSILKCIQEFGVTEFVEIGPKATLSGMVRDICKLHDIENIKISNFDKLDDLTKLQ